MGTGPRVQHFQVGNLRQLERLAELIQIVCLEEVGDVHDRRPERPQDSQVGRDVGHEHLLGLHEVTKSRVGINSSTLKHAPVIPYLIGQDVTAVIVNRKQVVLVIGVSLRQVGGEVELSRMLPLGGSNHGGGSIDNVAL